MEDEKLTKRQAQVLELISTWTEENGYPPSVREIGEALGLSSSATVHAHLEALEAKGYLHREGAKSRSLTISDKGRGSSKHQGHSPSVSSSIVELPLVGRVAAGQPILAEQNIDEVVALPKSIVGDTGSFILRVSGNSMVDMGILDGDYVVVKEQDSADDGDCVVALIDDSATVKTFYQEKDRVRLQPQNSTMEPIYVKDVVILGKVISLFRNIR